MKKILLNESERKAAILDREKAIVENFAKTFNKIKRLDENEVKSNNVSPEALVDKAVDKMEHDSSIPKVAQQIANDPKAMAELQKVLSNLGINVNEGVGINPEQIALAFVKKSGINEDYGAGFWTGLLGGGALAHYIYSVPAVGSVIAGASTSPMTETMIGSIIGATLGVLAAYIYEKRKANKRIDENEVAGMETKELEKKAFDFANSPEMGQLVDKILAKSKPEDLQKIKTALGSVSENMMYESDFSSFLNIAHKAQSTLSEDNSVGNLQNSVGKALQNFGVANIMSMGMLPAVVSIAVDYLGGPNLLQAVGNAVGTGGGGTAALSVVASLIGGALLWRLGKAVSGEKVTGDTPLFEIDENVGGLKLYGVENSRGPYAMGPYTFEKAKAIAKLMQDTSYGDDYYEVSLYNDLRNMLPAIERMQTPKLDKNGKFEDVDSVGFSSGDLADY